MATRTFFGPATRAVALATAVMTGCLLVSPLGEFEETKARGGAGGAAQGGDSPEGGSAPTGGSSTEGGTSMGGAPGGAGGEAGEGGCKNYEDCVRILGVDAENDPVRCRPSDRTCVRMKTNECFLTYGDFTDDDAVFLGAFANYYAPDPSKSETVYPLRLAIDELNHPRTGDERLPGLGGRSLVVTICNNADGKASVGLEHLVNELEVPAILASLKPNDLIGVYTAHDDRLYLSPVGRTSAVSDLDEHDPPMIWNLLGQPSDYADPYAALLVLVEQYLLSDPARDSADPLRVALVVNESDEQTMELGQVLEGAIRINGKTFADNVDDGNAQRIRMVSTTATGVTNAFEELKIFVPDIIVSAAGSAFTRPMGIVEQYDTYLSGGVRPFYVVSPYEAGDLEAIRTLIDGQIASRVYADLHARLVGLSVAPPVDTTLQNEYETRLLRAFSAPDDRPNPDTGNYYDAMYYLAYAAYGAGFDEPLTGERMAAGLTRLLTGDNYDVGPAHADPIFRELDNAGTLALQGTLGPPDFTDGYRYVNASAFCIGLDSMRAVERRDVLIYNGDNGFDQPIEWRPFPCFDRFIVDP